MRKTGGARRFIRGVGTAVCLAALAPAGFSASIGQWTGGANANQVWAASGNFSSIFTSATVGAPAHTVTSTAEITQQSLSNYQAFSVANPQTALSGAQISALVNWVQTGGVLLLYATPMGGTSSVNIVNSILTSLGPGSSGQQMAATSTTLGSPLFQATGGSLTGNDPAVSGLTGARLSFYQAFQITGGSLLSTSPGGNFDLGRMLRSDTFQLGRVYVFGERFDANWNLAGSGSNRDFFLNLMAQNFARPPGAGQGGDPFSDAPEPATLGLTGLTLVAAAVWHRRRKA